MITLRPYQQECVDNVVSDLNAYDKLLCVAPTGSGKTVVFGAMVKEYLNKFPDKRVMILSHLGLLTKQTGDSFKSLWGVDSEVLQADEIPSSRARCIIGTMQTARNEDKIDAFVNKMDIWKRTKESLNIDLIIIDEAHYFGTASYNSVLSMFPNSQLVGFTATPLRQNKMMTDMFDRVSFSISMQELIDAGYLVKPEMHLVRVDTTEIENVYASMYNLYKQKHNGEPSIMFFRTKEQAKTMRNILESNGITAAAVTSDITGQFRDEIFDNFRAENGKYNVLTTVDVLTAGFDAPCVRSIYMPFRINSVVAYLQRVGRGLRPHEGKTKCDIYCGSEAPEKEEGQWEASNRLMLNHGKKEYDTLTEEFEFMSERNDSYEWTEETVRLIREARKSSMSNIADMIDKREFPQDLLDIMKGEGVHAVNGKRAQITSAQVDYIGKNKIIDISSAVRLTRDEAINLIYAWKRKNGYVPQEWEIVKGGMHDGKHFGLVPKIYWKFCKNSGTINGYREWKKRSGN